METFNRIPSFDGGCCPFFGTFTKLWKVTISFIMSICLHGTPQLPLDGFSWNLIFGYFFANISRKFKFHYNLTKIMGFYMNTSIHFLPYLTQFFLEWEMLRQVVEKMKTYNLCSITFFMETVPFRRWCGKVMQSWAGHRWQYSTWALHYEYLRLPAHTHNILYLLLFHGNSGCTNVPQCYITHTLPVLLVMANRTYNQDF